MSKKNVQSKKNRLPASSLSAKKFNSLALSSAVCVAMFGGYGRSGYAGSCTGSAPDFSFSCAGPADPDNDVTIDLNGFGLSVTTADGFGMETTAGNAFTLGALGGLTFTDQYSSAITGYAHGIEAQNSDSGDLSITTTGIVTGGENGIDADSNSRGSLTISVVDVIGGENGIEADNFDQTLIGVDSVSSLTISAVNVTGTSGAGIRADNRGAGVNLSITTTGAVTGGTEGIQARNYGTGSLAISVADVTGAGGSGISATNGATGVDLSITSSGTVKGGTSGINANNEGTGSLTISAVDVTGTAGDGISAYNSAAGTDLSITSSGAVSGGLAGISVDNYGTGSLAITAVDVTGGANNQGIQAYNSSDGVDLSIATTGTVKGGVIGINADNDGTGSLTITAVDVTGASGNGIQADNSAAGADLSITSSGAVSGGEHGILVDNYGTGSLAISANTVTGTAGHGIQAGNSAEGTGLSITSKGTVSGGLTGILADNQGTGSLAIGAVDVTGIAGYGIQTVNRAGGASLSITTKGTVTGALGGIEATNYGTGSLTISAVDVTGSDRLGIYAANHGVDLSIETTGAVTGASYGIQAVNYGTGSLTISAVDVTGASGRGIYAYNGIQAYNSAAGASLSITSKGTVTGASNGISADNDGSGSLTITANTVTSAAGHGIQANNSAAGADLSITTKGTVKGLMYGILADNYGTGSLTISAVDVTGTIGHGIRAVNHNGVDLSIETTGAVTGGENGIDAENGDSGGSLTITANTVTGTAGHGIRAAHNGSGDLTITTAGAVSAGETGVGIITTNQGGGATVITVNAGSSVTGGAAAISTDFPGVAVASADTVNIFGSITGDINLGGGEDTVNFSGTMTGDISLGAGEDQVNIRGGALNGQVIGSGEGVVTVDIGAGNEFVSNGVVDVKDYVIRSGRVLQRGGFSTAGTTTTIEAGASLAFDGAVNGSGALASAGDLQFVFSDGSAGQLVQDDVVTLDDGSTITLSGDARSQVGAPVLLLSATEVVDGGVSLISDLGILFDAPQLSIGQQQVAVSLGYADLSSISSNPNIAGFGAALDSVLASDGDSPALDPVLDPLAAVGAGDVAGFEAVLDRLAPSASGALAHAGGHASDATWRLLRSRLLGNSEEGDSGSNGLWVQLFGGRADRQALGHVRGFDADSRGLALGYDRELDDLRLGLALSSGQVSVDNHRAAADAIDVDSLQLSLYGRYSLGRVFLNASAGFGRQDYDLARGATEAGRIRGSTDGDLTDISLGGGYDLQWGSMVLTPSAQLRYQSLSVDPYRERGGLDLQVEYDDMDRLRQRTGAGGLGPVSTGGLDHLAPGPPVLERRAQR